MRLTMKVEVEVTVETEYPRSFTAEALAADVGEVAIPYIMSEYGNVVVMTVSPEDAKKRAVARQEDHDAG